MKKGKILFIDMDGVLANFDKGINGDLNNMYKEGFFLTLEPMEEGINETIQEIKESGVTVKILSKACVDRFDSRFLGQMLDKVEWIKKFVPCMDELDIIIQGIKDNKGTVISFYEDYECILIDDYSKNLAEWVAYGGKAIKKAKRIKPREFKQVLNISELAIENIL